MNGSGDTRCGCWRRVGRRWRWNGTRILLANGPGHSQRAVPRRWFLNRVVVPPPALDVEQRAELKAAVQGLPEQAGIDLSNWNWKAVRQFVVDRFGLALSRSSCLNYLHRLGFVLKRPKKRLVKADPARRKAFVAEYAALTVAARRAGAKIFFADEAHLQADADLRGKWVLKGEPALVDSTSPRRGEKASYYSAVCLETGEVEMMELEGNSNAATSTAFLRQLRARHTEPLTVIWDNSPAHRGDAIRAYLTTSDLNLRLVNLPSYSPDFNAPIFDQSRHLGLGTPRGNCQPVPGHPCCGARKGGRLFRPPVQPPGRNQAPLPYGVTSTSGRTDQQHPSRISRPGKCRFHLGLSLGAADIRPRQADLDCRNSGGDRTPTGLQLVVVFAAVVWRRIRPVAAARAHPLSTAPPCCNLDYPGLEFVCRWQQPGVWTLGFPQTVCCDAARRRSKRIHGKPLARSLPRSHYF